jgi:two-component system chemotaxis sensor kinase CheA
VPDDLQRYFAAEARELIEGLTQAALQLERTLSLPQDQRKPILRLAHTLKGAARVVKEHAIADAAHAIEDLLAGAGETVAPAIPSRLLQLIDTIAAALPEDPAPARTHAPATPSPDEAARVARVELTSIDAALERVADISLRCAELRQAVGAIAPALPLAARHLDSAVDRIGAEVVQLRAELHEMRLASAGSVFTTIERAVRDAAQASNILARFEAMGGEHRLDADALLLTRDALIQLARNAVAHGIEPAAARAAAAKPPEGVVSLVVQRRGADVAFTLSDDGRGLDLARLRQAAGASGLGDRLSEEDIIGLLLDGGLSSRDSVSQIAGRGVGLDLVRATAARVGGRVRLRSQPGRGVSIELRVPVSLRSLRYLRLESGDAAALVPLEAVRGSARVADMAVADIDGRPHLVVERRPVPMIGVDAILAGRARGARESERVAALVEAEDGLVAVCAERFGETGTTISQRLPALAAATAAVRGVAVDESGLAIAVLEPAELGRLASQVAAVAAAPVRSAPRLLVIDDSITTRMLEQNILEGAGYEIDTAASAEEGLARAAGVPYDLFIVDVEMPGMSGFEFVERARADAALAGIPAILVTSRSSAADRRRGLEAGARAYIVKGEFDQEVFLGTVRGLVG